MGIWPSSSSTGRLVPTRREGAVLRLTAASREELEPGTGSNGRGPRRAGPNCVPAPTSLSSSHVLVGGGADQRGPSSTMTLGVHRSTSIRTSLSYAVDDAVLAAGRRAASAVVGTSGLGQKKEGRGGRKP